ncbi:MAG: hypothetical protein AAFO69_13010, partial [Bacteroidota bacterium]
MVSTFNSPGQASDFHHRLFIELPGEKLSTEKPESRNNGIEVAKRSDSAVAHHFSRSVKSILKTARQQAERRQYDSALQLYQIAGKLIDTTKFSHEQHLLWNELGHLHRRLHQYDSSAYYFHRVCAYTSDTTYQISALTGLGLNYQDIGVHIDAIDHFQKALELLSDKTPYYQTALYRNIIRSLTAPHERITAERLYRNALEIGRQLASPTDVAASAQAYGEYLLKIEVPDVAIHHLNLSREIYHESDAFTKYLQTTLTILEAHVLLKDWPKAETISDELADVFKKINDPLLQYQYLVSLARLHLLHRSPIRKDDINTIKKAERLAMAHHLSIDWSELYALKSHYFSKKDPKAALNYLLKHNAYKDSLQRAADIAYLKMRHIERISPEVNQIHQTTTDDLAFETMQTKQHQIVIIASVASTSLLVIVLYLLFLRKRNHYQNRLSSLQQRILRIQMNPHFLFNEIGSTV